MAETSTNYWPKAASIPDSQNPIVFLKEIAAQLSQSTDGVIHAQVIECAQADRSDYAIYRLKLSALSDKKRHSEVMLLTIRQPTIAFFPLFSKMDSDKDETLSNNLGMFEEAIRRHLDSYHVVNILSTMLTLANGKPFTL